MARTHSGSRMPKNWIGINLTANRTLFTVNSTSVIGDAANILEAVTVLRMIGEYIIGPTVAPSVNDAAAVSVGIGIFSSDAVALGGTAMPDPGAEPDFLWLFWAKHPLIYQDVSLDPSSPVAALRRSFDIRSMRKVKSRESIAMVVDYEDNNGAPPVTFWCPGVRILVAT